MSIFGIIGICLLIGFASFSIGGLIGCIADIDNRFLFWVTNLTIAITLWISATFIGIEINTEKERIYVKKYIAQKETIEISLESETLTGYERIQLVTKATELNGELAEKKARFDLWHFVVYDNTIYDNVEFINLEVKNEKT